MDHSVATIGFFDGVHRGHQFVVGSVEAESRRRSLRSLVVTFDRHPRSVVAGAVAPPLLTTRDCTQRLLRSAGADDCCLLTFDARMAALPARAFMQQVLAEQLGVSVLMMGYDNRFGHRSPGSTEGFADYVAYGREVGIEVVPLPELPEGSGGHISSSTVRQALLAGNVALAHELLGRPYALSGTVVHGRQVGRDLGFPTANLAPESVPQLVPAAGVYAVAVFQEGASPCLGMMNIGTRPTFQGHSLSLEVHLLGRSANLYDRRLGVAFLARLRAEQSFATVLDLQQQLLSDRQQVVSLGQEIDLSTLNLQA